MKSGAIVLACLFTPLLPALSAQTPSAVSVSSVPATTALFGQSVTLTATITPAAATGKVTFYDGVGILGSAGVQSGVATLTNAIPGYGARQITARYTGDATYSASLAPPVALNITTKPGGAFVLAGAILSSGVSAMAAADLNHDGSPDLVAIAGAVSVLINKGNGAFQDPAPYLTGLTCNSLAIADIDRDGNPDLVVACTTGAFLLLGKGDGTFLGPTSLSGATDLGPVRIADVNSDGYPDVILSHTSYFGLPDNASIEVHLGNGDGTFQTNSLVTTLSAMVVVDFAAGDFNRDGIVDLAVTSQPNGILNILFGVGDGTFLAPVVYQTDAGYVAVADVNHDGYQDVITGRNSLRLWLGTTNGTFQSTWNQTGDCCVYGVVDADGDGNPDLISAGFGVDFGNGDGTFRGPVSTPAAGNLLVVADFNGDGIADIASSSGSAVSIYLGKLAPLLTLTATPNPASFGQNVTLNVSSNFADATGTISFVDLLTGPSVGSATLSNGSAKLELTEPARGIHVYVATYSGDAKYAPTAAPQITVPVQQGVSLKLTASPNPAVPGQPVTLTATPSPNPGNALIEFLDDVTPLNYQILASSNVTFTTTFAAGVHQLKAILPEYLGYVAAPAIVTETVNAVPGGELIPGATYLTGLGPVAMVTGDFNGDGLLDIAVANSTGQSVSVFPGAGLGVFGPATTTSLTFSPNSLMVGEFNYNGGTTYMASPAAAIAVADFNGDGQPDFLTANAGSNNLTLTVGGGIGIGAGTYPDALVVADFNKDGNADFAVANRDSNNVMVFLGNGDGTFRVPVTIAAGSGPVAMATADFNGDKTPDFAIVDSASGQITILIGNGDGTFTAQLPLPGGAGASSIAVADLTGSGIPDIALTTTAGLQVYYGNGDGTFQPPANYPQYAGGAAVVAGSFDLDGRMQLAVLIPSRDLLAIVQNEYPTTVVVRASPSPASLGAKVSIAITVSPSSAVGFVTCYDGTSLVGSGIVTYGSATIETGLLLPGVHSLSARFVGALGYGPASSPAVPLTVTSVPAVGFAPMTRQNLKNVPFNLVPGDFNNDGIEDFEFLRSGNGLVSLIGYGDGTFVEFLSATGGATPLVAAGFTNDGNTDVAYSNPYATVAIGLGDGIFATPLEGVNATYDSPAAMAAADVNHDAFADLILANPNGTVDVLLGLGDGSFQPTRNYPGASNPTALAIGDFNEDGNLDIIVAGNVSSSGGELNVLTGIGDGSFAGPRSMDIAASPVSIATGDFNGDGHADLAVASSTGQTVAIFLGKGNATFGGPMTFPLGATPVQMLAADVNGDGIPDLVVMFTTGSPAFAVLYGNGDGSFQTPVNYQDDRLPMGIAVGDFNRDGLPDIALASATADSSAGSLDIFAGTSHALAITQGSGQSAAAGTKFATALQVMATPGTDVRFSAPSTGASGAFGAYGTTVPIQADSKGLATAPAFTANQTAGSYLVTVSAPGSVGVSFSLTNSAGPPASITVSAGSGQSGAINGAFGSPLQALVTDASGNPVPNTGVTFTAPAALASATFAGGLSVVTIQTNASGIASAPATANGITGSYTVSATVAGVASPASFSLTNSTTVLIQIGRNVSNVTYSVDGQPSGYMLESFNWVPGDQHTLSVSPLAQNVTAYGRAYFAGWSDGGAATHIFTVPSSPATIIANFKSQAYITIQAETGGTVSPSSGYFDGGTTVTVTATPDPGYVFQNWGNSNVTVNPLTVEAGATSIEAIFEPVADAAVVSLSHGGNFASGQNGATYTVNVSNPATGSSGLFDNVIVTEMVPEGLTVTLMTGSGWNCAGVACSRSASPTAGFAYPPITVTVNVASNAPAQVTNVISVSMNGILTASDPTTIGSSSQPILPVAAFLDQNGAPALTFNGSTGFPDAGGFLIGAPGVTQDLSGNVYVVGLDGAGGVHLNSYSSSGSAWNGWQYSGGILDTSSGLTAAVDPNGVVWFTGRDIGNRFWINSWNGMSFGGWILVADGIFAPDSIPQIAIPSDGSIYIIGKDIGGRIWSNSYNPTNQTFTGWVDRQAVMIGQPSATAGQDGMVYVAVRSVASESPVYISQIPAQNAATANTWLNGGGEIDTDPQITSQGGTVYLLAEADGDTVYLLTFTESSQMFGTWSFTNGILSDATIAAAAGNVFIAGRDNDDRIYWYSLTGDSWFFAGGAGISSTVLAGGK